MFYKLYVPKQAVGASLVYFDLFRAASCGWDLEIMSVLPVMSGAVTLTGVVGIDLHLTRTTAIGTGGTAAALEGTDPTLLAASAVNSQQPLPGGITARLTPSGGADAGAVIAWRCVPGEEASGSFGYMSAMSDMVRGPHDDMPGLLVPAGTGIRVVQGSVAGTGNIGFDVTMKVRRK